MISWLPLLLSLLAPARARPEIAVFRSDDLPAYQQPIESFTAAINAPIALYAFHGDKERALALTHELKADPPPLIFALGAKAAWLAAMEFPDVPMVYAMVLDPARYGVAGPMATGVGMTLPLDLVLAQFQLFFPERKVLGFIASSTHGMQAVIAAQAAADRANLEVRTALVSSSRDLRRALGQMRREVDALWLLPDPELLTPANFRAIRDTAQTARLPVLAYSETLVRAGALMCVAPDYAEVGRQAAELARQVLAADGEQGALPPPVTPETPRVVLNHDTLEALGIKLDPALMDFVDEEIQATVER